jgi:hypothetical protein
MTMGVVAKPVTCLNSLLFIDFEWGSNEVNTKFM